MTACDVCDKEMTYVNPGLGGGVTVIGLRFRVNTEDPELAALFDEAMKPYQAKRGYNICYPCWLRSMGVKEEQTLGPLDTEVDLGKQ